MDHRFGPDRFTVYRAHGAQNWPMALTTGGRGEYRVAGQTITTSRGDLVLISPGTTQHYAPTDDDYWGHWWAHFQPRPTWLAWWRRLPEVAPGFFLTSFETPHMLQQAVAAFSRVHRYAILSTVDTARGRVVATPDELSGALAGELALNGIEELLLLLAVVAQENQQRKRPDPRVQLVLETIAREPVRPTSVEELARMVSLSPSRLAHVFRREVDDSIVKRRHRNAAKAGRPIARVHGPARRCSRRRRGLFFAVLLQPAVPEALRSAAERVPGTHATRDLTAVAP